MAVFQCSFAVVLCILVGCEAQLAYQHDGKRGSAFSSSEFKTDATIIRLNVDSTIAAAYPHFANVGVYVDGHFHGETSGTVRLPHGPKVVTVVNGVQSRPLPEKPPLGTWLSRIEANAPLEPVPPRQVILSIYGDSIAAGDGAEPVTKSAWAMIVSQLIPVHVEAWGYRSLHEDSGDLDALVASLLSVKPNAVWLAIGTNDYGLNKWSADDFERSYRSLLEKLRGVKVYAQTPITRSPDEPNKLGDRLDSYRQAIVRAAEGLEVEVIDGSHLVSHAGLKDGVHPNNSGHADYARGVLAKLLPLQTSP